MQQKRDNEKRQRNKQWEMQYGTRRRAFLEGNRNSSRYGTSLKRPPLVTSRSPRRGEPGIGKTRLLHEVATRAEQGIVLVLRGGASEAEGMPPYLPFLEALGGYIRTAPREQLRAQVGSVAPLLATILPELRGALGEVPPGYRLPAEQARLRLFEAVGIFISALATTAPIVLLLDDLHWADPTSLDLLCHLARQCSTSRLLLVGAYRSDALADHPALERALLELTRLRVLTSLSLGPLSEAEVANLAQSALGNLIDQQTAQLLHTHSEGNPFFVEEVLRTWLETGALTAMARYFTLGGKLPIVLPASIVGLYERAFCVFLKLLSHSCASLPYPIGLALHFGDLLNDLLAQPSLGLEGIIFCYVEPRTIRVLFLCQCLTNEHMSSVFKTILKFCYKNYCQFEILYVIDH